jgi:hypothetical protein
LDRTVVKSRAAEEEVIRDVEHRMFDRKDKGHGSGGGRGVEVRRPLDEALNAINHNLNLRARPA